jgi:hypothetical protein
MPVQRVHRSILEAMTNRKNGRAEMMLVPIAPLLEHLLYRLTSNSSAAAAPPGL